MKKGRRSDRFPFFECLYNLCYQRVSDNVFVPEEYCLDALYVFCELDAFEKAGVLLVRKVDLAGIS